MRGEMVTVREHFEALREADLRAIQIKDEADQRALALAIEAQRYRDEQHNKLREQIAQERGEYVTLELYNQRHEALRDEIKGLSERVTEFVAATAGRSTGSLSMRDLVFAVVMGLLLLGGIISPHIG